MNKKQIITENNENLEGVVEEWEGYDFQAIEHQCPEQKKERKRRPQKTLYLSLTVI